MPKYKIIDGSDCNDEKKVMLKEAFDDVELLLEDLINLCNPKNLYLRGGHTATEKAVFKKYLGSYRAGRKAAWNVFKKIDNYDHTIKIKANFDRRDSLNAQFQAVDPDNTRAFVDENTRVINFCDNFYRLNRKYRAEILLHELTHFCARTEDFNLNANATEEDIKNFALNNEENARCCAYNFEFFARHLPEQEELTEFEQKKERIAARNPGKYITRNLFNNS